MDEHDREPIETPKEEETDTSRQSPDELVEDDLNNVVGGLRRRVDTDLAEKRRLRDA